MVTFFNILNRFNSFFQLLEKLLENHKKNINEVYYE